MNAEILEETKVFTTDYEKVVQEGKVCKDKVYVMEIQITKAKAKVLQEPEDELDVQTEEVKDDCEPDVPETSDVSLI